MVGVIGLTHVMNFYLAIKVMSARKTYNCKYPNLYLPEDDKNAKSFNCVQRVHQNTLEGFAPVQILMLVNGIVYPLHSAAYGFVWMLGRIVYSIGYS